MKKSDQMFSIALVLSVLTLFTSNACAQPALNRTTTGFTVVHPESNKEVNVKVTFRQDGTVYRVERCLSEKDCEPVELKDQKELYSCVPLEDGEKPDGTRVILRNPIKGKDQPYDCQYVTATEPGEPVIFKTGDNTSCPMIINGRFCDPCKGIF